MKHVKTIFTSVFYLISYLLVLPEKDSPQYIASLLNQTEIPIKTTLYIV
ncbi:hypothetical protein SPFL3102_01954 [Sporomusaceae bacterium FL31]|nr:hypothetical protein SPFL3101_03588 [Sporomusaceae bacterium FL31]GCE34145.1 hypothetical protein SPFL3102_01954 [Sporomusaceae bacterium]